MDTHSAWFIFIVNLVKLVMSTSKPTSSLHSSIILLVHNDQDEQTIIHDAESQKIETMTLKTTTIEEFDIKCKRMVKEWTVTRVLNHRNIIVVPIVTNFM